MKTFVVLLTGALLAPAAWAEESKEARPKPVVENVKVPLRLNLVLTRYQGDKKIGSRPYIVSAIAHTREETASRGSVFFGSQVKVVTSVNNAPTVTFKDVGVKVNCLASIHTDGRYRIDLKFDDSSVFAPEGARASGADDVIRSFAAEASLFLRDGESAPVTSAVDPVTGDVLKADITLTVLK